MKKTLLNKACENWETIVTVTVSIGILVLVIVLLSQRSQKHLHLSGYFNWIECRSDTAGYRETPEGKVLYSTGIQGIGMGDFDAVMFIDSTSKDTVNHLMLYGGDSAIPVHHGETFPNTFKITPKDSLTSVFVTMHLTGNKHVIDFPLVEMVTPPEGFDTLEHQSDFYIPQESEPWPNLYMFYPSKQLVRISVAESPVMKFGGRFLPPDLFAQAPQGAGMIPTKSSPLQLDSVHSLVFQITSSDSARTKFRLISKAVTSRISGGVVSIGNTTKKGDYVISTVSDFQLSSIYLNSKTNVGFALALSPLSSAQDYFLLQGSATYIKIAGTDIKVGLGKDRIDLDKTERLEMEGEFILYLYFSPPSLPNVQIDGRAKSVKLNNIEILPSRWRSIDANVRGPIIGALIAAIASVIIGIFTARAIRNALARRRRPSKKSKSKKT